MSLRELRALTEGESKKPSARMRLRSRAGTVMSHDEEAEVRAANNGTARNEVSGCPQRSGR